LNEIAGSVARAHAASMAEGGIHLEEHLAREPAWVLGHADKLKQLVHNLVGNAIEAMAGTDIRVATLAVRRQGGDYELSVRDTGPGIADLVSIFTPGYTTKASGTGMGLALSQQIARQHGGRLLARAVDGGGAEFTLRIAAVDDEELG
jgi:two-component system C4-dicarboxylate transport sensor histidine kinase DctB